MLFETNDADHRLNEGKRMNQPVHCPLNGTPGRKVDGATVKAMLSISLRNVRDVTYYFCREPDCDVVYFSEDGTQVFRKHEMRERVYQKELNDPNAPVCYCFRYAVSDITREIAETGKTDVIEDIKRGIQAGQCACDLRNPQGDCCLGNVSTLVNKLTREP
jgi:hypothetical protein